jgi:hypothetical protein
MRTFVCLAVICIFSHAQEITRYSTDVNGRRVVDGQISTVRSNGDFVRMERTQSVNGREVPLEQVEERVLRDDAGGKLLERIIKRFDATGVPGDRERVLIEQNADGSRIAATTYRSDVNGAMAPVEKSITEVQKSGSTTTADTTIQRPSLNGYFEKAERRQVVIEEMGATVRQNISIERRDPNGGFVEAYREVKEVVKADGKVTENTAVYEPGLRGEMRLSSQAVATTLQLPGGRTVTEVNLFSVSVPGTSGDPTGRPQVKEQQIIERKPSNGGFVETLSVRRPSLSDPTRLGPAQLLYETVCKGNCNPPAEPKPEPKQQPQL